jgi:hypothetical protein
MSRQRQSSSRVPLPALPLDKVPIDRKAGSGALCGGDDCQLHVPRHVARHKYSGDVGLAVGIAGKTAFVVIDAPQSFKQR